MILHQATAEDKPRDESASVLDDFDAFLERFEADHPVPRRLPIHDAPPERAWSPTPEAIGYFAYLVWLAC